MAPAGKFLNRAALKQHVGKAVKPLWRKQKGNYGGFMDEDYYAPTQKEVDSVLVSITYPTYAANEFDCEDFAYMCKAEVARAVRNHAEFNTPWAFGIAFARFRWISHGTIDHACNWVVTDDGTLHWIEPQTGNKHKLKACRKGSLALMLG